MVIQKRILLRETYFVKRTQYEETAPVFILNLIEMQRLVDMQQRSYLLLKWMAKSVSNGIIDFQTAHDYSTLSKSARDWIEIHYLNIPEKARPPYHDLESFTAFFSTYLTNSFDLISNPGKQLYSPYCHCFCPMCSWLREAPNLKVKKLKPTDKRYAYTMQTNVLLNLAIEHQLRISDETIDAILNKREHSVDVSLVAYGHDLHQREKGIANGPAILVLWRNFAWNPSGSPQKYFRLKAENIIEAEKRIIKLLKSHNT